MSARNKEQQKLLRCTEDESFIMKQQRYKTCCARADSKKKTRLLLSVRECSSSIFNVAATSRSAPTVPSPTKRIRILVHEVCTSTVSSQIFLPLTLVVKAQLHFICKMCSKGPLYDYRDGAIGWNEFAMSQPSSWWHSLMTFARTQANEWTW